MICIILAAGYATRLYPLTENFPKPLLPIGGQAIIDWLLDDIDTSANISEYAVVSNHRFINHFEVWARRKNLSAPVRVLDDGSTDNDTRIGAVMDIQLAIDRLNPTADLLVIAGDNVLDFSLAQFIRYAQIKQTSCVMRYYEPDINRLKNSGVAQIDENDRIIKMIEKPADPFSNWCTPPFYYYIKNDLHLIRRAIDDGCGIDAPGSLAAHLSSHTVIHAMEMPGSRYDIGTPESYQYVQSVYTGIVNAIK
ncbi:MAG: NTP transferase domain-containing protein [Oscillospiraceae bacterium]|jgi:glucose-1-phosphate thymidylyltransferase|nr:NTP transferase domain-containing protein [Oscillospiraceae bacterium]